MSLILNLETSSKNCSVSLSSKGKLIDLIESEDENYRHSELLTTSIQDILSKNNLNVNLWMQFQLELVQGLSQV